MKLVPKYFPDSQDITWKQCVDYYLEEFQKRLETQGPAAEKPLKLEGAPKKNKKNKDKPKETSLRDMQRWEKAFNERLDNPTE